MPPYNEQMEGFNGRKPKKTGDMKQRGRDGGGNK